MGLDLKVDMTPLSNGLGLMIICMFVGGFIGKLISSSLPRKLQGIVIMFFIVGGATLYFKYWT